MDQSEIRSQLRQAATSDGRGSVGRSTRRRRPHPARRARRTIAGASMGAVLVMTGYMTLGAAASSGAGATSTGTAATSTATTAKTSTSGALAATPSTTAMSTSASS